VNSNANLWIEADSLLYNDPFADHRNYLEIDIQSGQVQLVFESSEIRDFRMADYVRWASHDRVFDIVGRFEDGVQVRLVSDSEGHQLAVIPNYQCNRSTNFEDFESIWLDGQLYFFDQLPSGNCRLMQLSRDYTETMVLQTFPSGAQYFGFLESENEWWVVYDIERTEYLVNFDGSLTYLLIELDEDSYISTWVENELPQGDYRVALGIGVVCIGSGWILRRRRL
jgi:hypothetical protein